MVRPQHIPSQPRLKSSISGDWLKIIVMGSLLGVLGYLILFVNAPGGVIDTGEPPIWEESTPVPELDAEIMARARDGKRAERLVTDVEPLKHLLEKSLSVTPAVAHKLGMVTKPVPISRLRNDPGRYRGNYLWYKGQLEYLSHPQVGHPVPGYDYYEGRLRTADNEPVLFAFSVPPATMPKTGDWVRMEGFFLKLRDAHFPAPLDQAPMLVGPELFAAFADWEPVEQLDPSVLARVRDGRWNGDHFEDDEDMGKLLSESQDEPLWHLASFVMRESKGLSKADWPRIPPFVQREQFEECRTDEFEKGRQVRLLGTFVGGRILPAKVNPLGIESWSEVWVQVRDLGGKTIPIWIPGRIDQSWKRNMPVTCFAWFFKRYTYTSMTGDVRWTPLFLAANLDHFSLSQDSLSNSITLSFAGLIGAVGFIFFLMAWRDRRQRQRHEDQMVGRRQKRRGAASAG